MDNLSLSLPSRVPARAQTLCARLESSTSLGRPIAIACNIVVLEGGLRGGVGYF